MPKKPTRTLPRHSAPYWMPIPTCIYCGRSVMNWNPDGCRERADREPGFEHLRTPKAAA